jgi:hypothetical protein
LKPSPRGGGAASWSRRFLGKCCELPPLRAAPAGSCRRGDP